MFTDCISFCETTLERVTTSLTRGLVVRFGKEVALPWMFACYPGNHDTIETTWIQTESGVAHQGGHHTLSVTWLYSGLRTTSITIILIDCWTSIDLKDSYQHIPIYPPHRNFCVSGSKGKCTIARFSHSVCH